MAVSVRPSVLKTRVLGTASTREGIARVPEGCPVLPASLSGPLRPPWDPGTRDVESVVLQECVYVYARKSVKSRKERGRRARWGARRDPRES